MEPFSSETSQFYRVRSPSQPCLKPQPNPLRASVAGNAFAVSVFIEGDDCAFLGEFAERSRASSGIMESGRVQIVCGELRSWWEGFHGVAEILNRRFAGVAFRSGNGALLGAFGGVLE